MSVYTAKVVVVPISNSMASNFGDRLKEAFIKGRLRLFYIAASGLTTTPQSGDRIEFESKEWEIEKVDALNPAGTAVLYTALAMEGGATT